MKNNSWNDMEDEEAEYALAIGYLQTAISLLHPKLWAFVKRIAPVDPALTAKQPDFAFSLKFVRQNWEGYFLGKCPASLKRIAERAERIRNIVSHQARLEDPDRALDTLARLAVGIGEEKLAEKIRSLRRVPQPAVTPSPQPTQEQSPTSSHQTKKQRQKQNPTLPPKHQESQPQPQPVKKKKRKKSKNKGGVPSWQAFKDKGYAAFKQGQFTEAMTWYTRAIGLAPKEAILYSNRALCELRLNKFALAREDAEDAIELDPKQVKYYRLLSEALFNLKLYQEAAAACEAGLDLDPRDESLSVRLRDCGSCLSIQATDRNPHPSPPETLKELSAAIAAKQKLFEGLNIQPDEILALSAKDYKPRLALTCSLWDAHNYDEGIRGRTKQPRKAFKIFEAAAKEGCAEGLYNVGQYYLHGDVVPLDNTRALECFREAVQQTPFYRVEGRLEENIGVRESFLALGNAYRDGSGVDVDRDVAFDWYMRGARLGVPGAENNLGVMLWNGDGRPKDLKSAREWFRRAATKGLAEAMCNYADFLADGRGGGPADPHLAKEYYEKAIALGVPNALEHLQRLARGGSLGGSALTGIEKLMADLVKKNDPDALFLLGNEYFEGTSAHPKDQDNALKLWEAAAKKDHVEAAFRAATHFLEEKKDPSKGFGYMLQAAGAGDPQAQLQVAKLYAYGHGCTRDEVAARRFHQRASLQGAYWDCEISMESLIKRGRELVRFEQEESLSIEGLTIPERGRRAIKRHATEESAPRNKILEQIQALKQPTPDCPIIEKDVRLWLQPMAERAKSGSVMALAFVQATKMIEEGMQLVRSGEEESGLGLVLDSYRVWEAAVFFQGKDVDILRSIAKRRLDERPKDLLGLMLILRMVRMGVEQTILFVRNCIEAHPREAVFHRHLACMYGFQQKWSDAIRVNDRALELDPDDSGMLYERGTFLRLLQRPAKEVIAAYQAFLQAVPGDHRKVPEAHYSLGSEYFRSGDRKQAKLHFDLGRAAEDPSVRLPCFGPVEDFPPKLYLSLAFGVDPVDHEDAKPFRSDEAMHTCETCHRANPKFRCPCATVAYCDRDCQKQAWPSHKLLCKKVNSVYPI